MGFMFCSTGIVDCGAELVLGAVWVMKLMLEVTEDVAGATEAVAGIEPMRNNTWLSEVFDDFLLVWLM